MNTHILKPKKISSELKAIVTAFDPPSPQPIRCNRKLALVTQGKTTLYNNIKHTQGKEHSLFSRVVLSVTIGHYFLKLTHLQSGMAELGFVT